MAHIRTSDGSHRFIDGQSTVPLAVRPDTYTSKPGSAHDVFDTTGDENLNGPKAVAVPGSLKAWCADAAAVRHPAAGTGCCSPRSCRRRRHVVAAQFALTVVEPMIVGLIGGTTSHIRLADGSHRIIDSMSAGAARGHPTMYRPIPARAEVYDVERREPGRPEGRRRRRARCGLVPHARTLRHHGARRRHAARDQTCRARLYGHALSLMNALPTAPSRDAQGQGDRGDLSARRDAAQSRRAGGAAANMPRR